MNRPDIDQPLCFFSGELQPPKRAHAVLPDDQLTEGLSFRVAWCDETASIIIWHRVLGISRLNKTGSFHQMQGNQHERMIESSSHSD